MKILISYPPIDTRKGCPTIGQNRQFQYFKEPTFIYPVVPAQAATLLKRAGHEPIWNDCIAQGWSRREFLDFIVQEEPDLIAIETKTPVVKQHWRLIDEIKGLDLKKAVPRIVLFGDHVTALPEESFLQSKVDFVLTGGDYDFLLLNLCNVLSNKSAAELEPGIYYRENGQVRHSGPFRLDHDLDSLPFLDRDLTRWYLYAYKNGNYKRTPGTYIMAARDCWWGNCSFCSWPALYPKFRSRTPDNVIAEAGMLAEKYAVREIMDDSGCFPAGDWLRAFCRGMIARGISRKAYFDCNMRFGALSSDDFALMKKANFRLLLFGLESANQATLDRINKGVRVERIIQDCKAATRAGLFPHITIMFGYPWESYEDARKTLKLGTWLLRKGYAYTMQATVVIPYPGTRLYEECRSKGWLTSADWDDYDMKQPLMRTAIPADKMLRLVQAMYKVSFHPEFVMRKLFSLRDTDDLKYSLRASRKVIGHIFDFKKAGDSA